MMIAFPVTQWSDDAVFILDFLSSTLPAPVTFTRASSGWYFNSSGNLTSASSNVARLDYGTPGSTTPKGLLVEEARTNQIIQCRDFTQTAWVKVTTTTALNQTGIDGLSSTATLLTASSANATTLQTITQAATTSVFSVYLKRITGTGNVQLTNDGITFTTITLTTSWQRFNLAAASTLNPILGIKIVTSGDAVAIDGAQFEAGSVPSSVILTTTTSVTRAVELAIVSSAPWLRQSIGSFQVETIINNASPGTNQVTAELSDGTTNNRIGTYASNSSTALGLITLSGSSTFTNGSIATPSAGSIFKQSFRYTTGANNEGVNGALDAAGSAQAATVPTGITTLYLGNRAGSDRPMNGWVRKFRYWNYGITNAQLQRVST